MKYQSTTLSFRITKDLKNDFENFAKLSHTTTKDLLIDYICELLGITIDDQKKVVKCVICGKSFQTNNNVRKFCSSECRKKNNTALRKAWEFNNRAKSSNLLTAKDIVELRKETRCFYCGCELNDSNRTLDHFIPLCRGGANIRENVVACCFGCNNKKGTKTYEEFMATLKN